MAVRERKQGCLRLGSDSGSRFKFHHFPGIVLPFLTHLQFPISFLYLFLLSLTTVCHWIQRALILLLAKCPQPDRPDVWRSGNSIKIRSERYPARCSTLKRVSITMAAISHLILSTKSKQYQRDTFVFSTSLPARLLIGKNHCYESHSQG